jgi:outer membrane protein TolC
MAQLDTNAPAAPAADTNAPAVSPAAPAPAAPSSDTNAAMATTNTPPPVTLASKATAIRAMSLEDCLQEALQHNLDVQVERTAPKISLYNLRSAYSDYDPAFSLSGTHRYDKSGPDGFSPQTDAINSFNSGLSGTLTPWGTTYNLYGEISDAYGGTLYSGTNESSGGSIQAKLTQPLLKNFWINYPQLSIRVAKNQLKFDEQGLRWQIILSITAVEYAYYELIYARENVKVQEDALNLAQTQLDQDRQRVQIGTLAQLDVQQDEAQVATSRANLIKAQYILAEAQNTLKNLLTDQYTRWHDMDIQPTGTLTNAPLQFFDLQDSWSKGMTLRPDLVQYRLDVETRGVQLKYYRNQLFPELDLTGTYGYNGDAKEYSGVFHQFNERNRPYYSYGASLSVPLSSVNTRNQYRAAKETVKQALLKLKKFEQQALVDIDNAVKQAQSTYQSVDATRQARTYAEAALDAEQKKYAVGKSTTFTVLQLQNNLTTARSQEIRALADYYEALANLAMQEGTTLERNHIHLETK